MFEYMWLMAHDNAKTVEELAQTYSSKVSQQKTTDKIQLVFACAGLTIFFGISKDVASDNSTYYNYLKEA